jgi:hypothetical protein
LTGAFVETPKVRQNLFLPYFPPISIVFTIFYLNLSFAVYTLLYSIIYLLKDSNSY